MTVYLMLILFYLKNKKYLIGKLDDQFKKLYNRKTYY